MRAYFPQDGMTIHDGQIEVQQHKIDLRSINVPAAPEQKIERIFTIGRYAEMVIGVNFLKCVADQPHVGRVILNQQNLESRFTHYVMLPRYQAM